MGPHSLFDKISSAAQSFLGEENEAQVTVIQRLI